MIGQTPPWYSPLFIYATDFTQKMTHLFQNRSKINVTTGTIHDKIGFKEKRKATGK
jgi:hypothetical protein